MNRGPDRPRQPMAHRIEDEKGVLNRAKIAVKKVGRRVLSSTQSAAHTASEHKRAVALAATLAATGAVAGPPVLKTAGDIIDSANKAQATQKQEAQATFAAQVEQTNNILFPKGYADRLTVTMADVQNGLTAEQLTQRDLGQPIDPRHTGNIVKVEEKPVSGDNLTVNNAVLSTDRGGTFWGTTLTYNNGDKLNVFVPLPNLPEEAIKSFPVDFNETTENQITFSSPASPVTPSQ